METKNNEHDTSAFPEYYQEYDGLEFSGWRRLLNRMNSVMLQDMQEYALQRRYDTKYLVSDENQLLDLMHKISTDYSVLAINGNRLHQYQTMYYDTPDYLLYRQHHNEYRTRFKVRTRTYLSTNDSFLEIKQKTSRSQVDKKRIPIEGLLLNTSSKVHAFMGKNCPVPCEQLEPKLMNTFYRFTLVSHHSVERATIDLGMGVWNQEHGKLLPGIAVVEVKQGCPDRNSALVGALHDAGMRPGGFSKYCIGVSLLVPEIKHNRFKENLLMLERIMDGGLSDGVY